jgi:hypothetical protein
MQLIGPVRGRQLIEMRFNNCREPLGTNIRVGLFGFHAYP